MYFPVAAAEMVFNINVVKYAAPSILATVRVSQRDHYVNRLLNPLFQVTYTTKPLTSWLIPAYTKRGKLPHFVAGDQLNPSNKGLFSFSMFTPES